MVRILFGKSTLMIFCAICILAIVFPYLVKLFLTGSRNVGFPFVFLKFTSAPDPYFGSSFSFKIFLLDLLIYYLFAILIFFLKRQLYFF